MVNQKNPNVKQKLTISYYRNLCKDFLLKKRQLLARYIASGMSRELIFSAPKSIPSFIKEDVVSFFELGLNRADKDVLNELIWIYAKYGEIFIAQRRLGERLGIGECNSCKFFGKKDLVKRKDCNECYNRVRCKKQVNRILNKLWLLGLIKYKKYNYYSVSTYELSNIFFANNTKMKLLKFLPNLNKLAKK